MSAKFTPGPWQVVVTEHPHHLGGKHVERRIFTTWIHPQLKGPWPIVNGSVGIGAEKGGKPVHMVHLDEADANLIANAPDLHSMALELDRLSLVIESSVRFGDHIHYEQVLALLKANRATIAAIHGGAQ